MRINKHTILLIVILILALVVRIPGLLWGYHTIAGESFEPYNDEYTHFRIANFFLTGSYETFHESGAEPENYLHGFGFQVAAPYYIFSKVASIFTDLLIRADPLTKASYIVGFGRLMSLFFSIATVLLVYFFTRDLFKNRKAGVFASLLLSLSMNHVVWSHLNMPNMSMIFWFYLALYTLFLYYMDRNLMSLFLASLFAGFSIGTKFSFVIIVPVVYFALKYKSLLKSLITSFLGGLIGFIAINGFVYVPWRLFSFVGVLGEYPSSVTTKILSIFISLFAVLIGVGLPVFVVFCLEVYNWIKKANFSTIKKNIDIIFLFSPILIQFLLISWMRPWDVKNLVFFSPFIAIIAAKPIVNLVRKPWILAFILLYLIVGVAANEHYYIYDTRGSAAEWVSKNIGADQKIGITPYVYLPSEYTNLTRITDGTEYIVLSEIYYYRFLRKKESPILAPDCSTTHTWQGRQRVSAEEDCVFVRKLLDGETEYRLEKSFRVKYYLPETILYDQLFNLYVNAPVGDVLVYKKES